MALSEARKRANKKWNEKNKEKMKKYSTKSHAKKYVLEYANVDELKELEQLIKNRIAELESNENCRQSE